MDEERKTPLKEVAARDGPGGAALVGGLPGGVAALGGEVPQAVLQMMQQLYLDNQKLREEQETMKKKVEDSLAAAKVKEEYRTPESAELGRRDVMDLETERRRLYNLTPMEQFQKLQEDMTRAQEGRPALGTIPLPRQVDKHTEAPTTPPRRSTSGTRTTPLRAPRASSRTRTTTAGQGGGAPGGDERMQRQLDVVDELDQKGSGGVKEDAMEVVKPGVQQLPMLLELGTRRLSTSGTG